MARIRYYVVGDQVRLLSFPWQGFEGEVTEVDVDQNFMAVKVANGLFAIIRGVRKA